MIREADDDGQGIEVVLGKSRARSVSHDTDAFTKSLDNVSGIHPNLRKKSSRLEKRLEGDGDARSKQLEPDVLTAYSMLDAVTPPHNVDYLAALYNLSPVFRAAVQAKVGAIVGMGYDLVETKAAKQKLSQVTGDTLDLRRRKIENIKESMSDRLESCNDEMSFVEILRRFYTDVEVLGFGCIEIGRKSNGEIGYIGHIPAKTVRVRRKRDGYVQMISDKVVFFRNFGDTDTPNPVGTDSKPNELIFYTGDNYSPDQTYYGVPPVVAAKQAIAGNEFSARFNLDYFENKAVPRYVFVVKGAKLSDTSMMRLTEFFEAMKGENHRTLVVPLPADDAQNKSSFEMKPVETGIQDSSFMSYRQANTQEILMAHRVPANKVGLADGVDNSAARDMSKNFNETVTRPEQKNVERRLNRILKEWNDVVQIQLKQTALSDDSELAKQDQVYLTLGVMTPNDVRQRWGWSSLEGGDKTYPEQAAATASASQKAADNKANVTQSRSRDLSRATNRSDSTGEARNPKGSGRKQE